MYDTMMTRQKDYKYVNITTIRTIRKFLHCRPVTGSNLHKTIDRKLEKKQASKAGKSMPQVHELQPSCAPTNPSVFSDDLN